MQFRSSEVIWCFFSRPFFFCHLPCKQQYCWNFAFKKHGSWDDKLMFNDSVNNFFVETSLKIPIHIKYQWWQCSMNRSKDVPPIIAVQQSRQQEPPPSWRTRWPARRSASQHFCGQSRACLLRRHLKEIPCASLKAKWRKRQVLSWRLKSSDGDYIFQTMANIVINNKGLYTWNPNDL